ncbi:MAG: tetratricopeptide repeat protein [Planctomycetaceae bacterium]|nr:tetratricopeptide repeat protein [Planctomycetaceae bacterium]
MYRLIIIGICSVLLTGCSFSRNSEGLRYFEQQRYDQAMTSFLAALQRDPNNPEVYYNIAATYHQSARVSAQTGNTAVAVQQYDEAEKYYRLCLTKNPNHTSAYRGLSVLYLEKMNPDAAFQLLINWSNANPAASEPKIELARIYQEFSQICLAQGRKDVARTCLETTVRKLQEVIAVEPANYRALRALGYLREQGGDIPNALGDYRLSLQANPNQQDLAEHIKKLEQNQTVISANTFAP